MITEVITPNCHTTVKAEKR